MTIQILRIFDKSDKPIRSAKAAGSISDLIEETMKKVGHGSEFVKKTSHTFPEIITSSGKVAGLVGEIAATSRRQSRGVEQVNKTISETDRVTQQNVIDAEKAASISELKYGAKKMKGLGDHLIILAAGKNNMKKRTKVDR